MTSRATLTQRAQNFVSRTAPAITMLASIGLVLAAPIYGYVSLA
ncbi:MAG: hypothetical protein AAF742_07460 [Pseudomonadota bacterium]